MVKIFTLKFDCTSCQRVQTGLLLTGQITSKGEPGVANQISDAAHATLGHP